MKSDYSFRLVKAANSVLLELMAILGPHRKNVVVVGGLVPSLLLTDAPEPHVGSIDVDLVVDHRKVDEQTYARISERLLAKGYATGTQPFRFIREVEVEGEVVRVPVDFLAGEYGGTGRQHRHQQAGGLMMRKIRGGDLATLDPIEIEITGELPQGGKNSARCRVVQPVLFIVLKALALVDRLKPKDAYDLYFLLRNYPGGIDRLCAEFGPYRHHPVVTDALAALAEKFASPDHVGPQSVADFEGITDDEERDIVKRDAYERVLGLLQLLRVSHQ